MKKSYTFIVGRTIDIYRRRNGNIVEFPQQIVGGARITVWVEGGVKDAKKQAILEYAKRNRIEALFLDAEAA